MEKSPKLNEEVSSSSSSLSSSEDDNSKKLDSEPSFHGDKEDLKTDIKETDNKNYSSPAFTNYVSRGSTATPTPQPLTSPQQNSPLTPAVTNLIKPSLFLRPSKLMNPTITITAAAPVQTTNTEKTSILRPPRLISSQPVAIATAIPNDDKNEDSEEKFVFVPLLKEETANGDKLEEKKEVSATPTATFLFGQNLDQRVLKSDVVAVPTIEPTRKRKHDECDELVLTGEENESNVLQISCRLFTYAPDQASTSWIERGRGLLRLNDNSDSNKLQSRLIIRQKGSLRVMLNTKVWKSMVIEKPNEKSLRFTGFDSEEGSEKANVKIFLVMASQNEIEQLYSALECRIRDLD